jgi:WD40 repeat protein
MITCVTRSFGMLLLVLWCVPAVAAEPDGKEVARLVKQLGSSDFRMRDTATKRLTEIGEPALDALGKATDTVEMRRRAEAIIAVIENKICVEQRRLVGHQPNPNYKRELRNGPVTSVSVSADGKRVLTGGFDKTLRLWDAGTGKELHVFRGHTGPVTSVALSPDGTRALSAGSDNSVRLWDATTGKQLHEMAGHRFNGAHSVAFGPKGQALSGGGDGEMHLLDLSTGDQVGVLTCHTKPGIVFAAVTVAYGEKSRRAVTCGRNQPIRVWNLETGKEVRKVAEIEDAVFSLSPDGKQLVACNSDRKLRIFDVETGKELLRIDPRLTLDGKYESEPFCAAFSPDGKRIASGGYDNTVRIWDAKTGTELRKYEGHSGMVGCLTFFPDGKHIASASYDGTARI